MIRRRNTASIAAMRLVACALALVACSARAQGPGKPMPVARVTEGIYAVVNAASGAGESAGEVRVPIFTMTVPLAGGAVPPMQVGAHMSLGNQPRTSSAIVFSTVLSF
jgi:hypothetical protein